MAQWRKVIVSGSAAELSSLTLDTALPVAQGGIGATSLTDKAVLISQDSGTDAVGSLALTTNGSIIVGGTNGPAVEAASDVAGTGLTAVTGDGTLVINVDAAQTQITSVGTLGTGAISSGFGNIDIGTSTLNAGNTTVDNFTNNSAVADTHITGSISGSFTGDGSGLTNIAAADLDVDAFDAGSTIAQGDHFLYSDGGTEKKVTFSDVEDTIFGNLSGDISVAAGGAVTLANNSVSQAQLDDDAVGADELAANAVVNASIASNAAIDMDKLDGDSLANSLTDFAQDDLVILSDTSDSGNLKSMTTSNLEDAIFGNVSGDATIAAGGALTIAATSVENSMLAGSIENAKLSNSTISGVSLGSNLNSLSAAANGGISVTSYNGSAAVSNLQLDIDGMTDIGAGIASGDLFIIDDGANGTNRKTTVDRIATLFAGDGLSASSAVLSVGVDDSSIETNSDALRVKALGITNAMLAGSITNAKLSNSGITVGGTETSLGGTVTGAHIAAALNSDLGGSFTIGNQSDDTATFTGGVVVNGDLDVNGSLTTIDSTNLKVADRFIIAASGSSSGDGGLIVETSGAGSGSAFAYDDSASRWGLSEADGTGEGDTTIDTKQYVVSVSGSTSAPSGNPSDFGSSDATRIGMMHVKTDDGTIWIYS